MMCAVYGVARSGFYAWLRRQPSQHARQDVQLLQRVCEIHQRSRGYYGSPRVTGQLRLDGNPVGRRRVARLMRLAGLQGRSARLYRHSKVLQRAFYASVPHRLQDKPAQAANQVWHGDVTYLQVAGKWRYMAAVMDRHSRRIAGWSLGRRRDAALTVQALRQSARNRNPGPGLTFHTDRGVEYAAYEFRRQLAKLGTVAEHEPCWQDERQRSHGVVFPLHEVRRAIRQDVQRRRRIETGLEQLHHLLQPPATALVARLPSSRSVRAAAGPVSRCPLKRCKFPRSGIAPRSVLVTVRIAAQFRCISVNSDVRPHGRPRR
jgi:putative transposase